WAPPGEYTVKLTVNGKTLSQPLTVKPDPRVKTPALVMQQIYTLSTAAYREAASASAAASQAQQLRDRLSEMQSGIGGLPNRADVLPALMALIKKVEDVAGAAVGGGGRGGRGAAFAAQAPGAASAGQGPAGPRPAPTLSGAAAGLSGVMNLLQAADVQPTALQLKAIASARAAGTAAMARWTAIQTVDVPALN